MSHKMALNTIVDEMLLSRQDKPCPYCGRLMDVKLMQLQPTRDHIRSKKRFRDERDFRCIVVCSECNYMKGDMTYEEFFSSLIDKNDAFIEALRLNQERLIRLEYLMWMGLR